MPKPSRVPLPPAPPAKVSAFEALHPFGDAALLREALAIPHANRLGADNQRLEFLGDAVLQILASEALYARHPTCDEGHLSAMRAQLVSGKALIARAEALPGFVEALAEANLGHDWPRKALADALEAYFGAVWCDGGQAAARTVFARLFDERVLDSATGATDLTANPKGTLIAYAQARHIPLPRFALVAKSGPGHAPTFRCSATLQGEHAEGEGLSRKAAEAAAAQALLDRLPNATP